MKEWEPIHVEGWCGVEALQWVAEQELLYFTQSELARILGTTHENGTSHDQMIQGTRRIGLLCEGFSNLQTCMLPRLLQSNYIIVNWMQGPNEQEDGHYSPLLNIDQHMIYLKDAVMSLKEFEQKWYDITDEGRVDQWALIIKKQ